MDFLIIQRKRTILIERIPLICSFACLQPSLKSRDTKKGEDVSVPTRLKSEKSSKKIKSSQSEKKKITPSPEPSLKRTKDSSAEEKVNLLSLDRSFNRGFTYVIPI